MGNMELSTIPEKKSDEFIKSSVEDIVLILSESKDTSGSDSECVLPSCDDFSPINVSEEKSMTFSNPLFDSNDDFISSDDESLSDKEVPDENVKIYSNPLFEFDDEYISSDVIPFFGEDPEDSLVMGNMELSTIPEKKSNEFIKSSVEDIVLILSESKDTSGSDSECVLPSYDDFSPINVSEEKSVTFSNPLFDSNDDFISSDDESLSDKEVPDENVKIYSNPLFEFDDEYISSDAEEWEKTCIDIRREKLVAVYSGSNCQGDRGKSLEVWQSWSL
nr:hypothetical protein [Tanacetum cinerariifolium]